jgi:hypothetical protein
MSHHVALVGTDILEELSASFVRVTRIGELGTTLAVTGNRRMLRRNTKLVLTRATQRNIPEDAILHGENLKSYTEAQQFQNLMMAGVCSKHEVCCG